MKTKISIVLGLLTFVLTQIGFSAEGATNTVAPRRPQSIVSPEIHDDNRVTFRLRASKAAEVIVAGQWASGRMSMAKDANGVWSATTTVIEPGVWEYSLIVDGVMMIDPANPAIKPMREPRTSILHIRGKSPLAHDFQDVPHGTVHQHSYQSKSLGRVRELAVYTPPGYSKAIETRFPVLYLQHGMGDNQATWTAHGKAHWILDNLIAQGRAKPMVVVMMDGHAATMSGGLQNNTGMFERDLLEDVMPMVEANYRIKTDAPNRGIVGLSMGGGQSLTIGLSHPELFSWVGAFSAATPSRETTDKAFSDVESLNKKLKLLWIACGKDDFLLKRNEEFIALLKDKKVHHEWILSEGAHSWPVWRKYLAEFAPKLFQ